MANNNQLTWKIPKKRKGMVIDLGRCKGCSMCITHCEYQALILSKKFSERGYHYPILDPEKCTACRKCELICPDFAIFLVNIKSLPDEGDEN
ncbi:MAG: 4Fe-4S dicluster domain-containing protein [Candidatus Kariarchaeaceae archaeon]